MLKKTCAILLQALFSNLINSFFYWQMPKAIVYIEETNSMADVTFPSLPHVVSLLHYDDVRKSRMKRHSAHPPAGYPVVCVTVCLVVLSITV